METNWDMWKWGLLALCLAVISAVDARFCSDSSNVIKPQSPEEAVAATEDLWRAVAMNDVGWAKAAIARGADLNSRRPMVDSTYGSTPLHLAAWMGHIPVTVALAAAGADLEAKNEFDRTPIFEAAMNNRPEEVEILVALGADVTAKNKWGRGVMHLAAYGEDPTVIGVLLKAGADLSSGDNSGDTPLHLAIEDGNLEVVKAIVGFGASVKRRNNAGVTPLKKALENKRYAIAEYIRSTGGYE